jgi:hypothetical protein
VLVVSTAAITLAALALPFFVALTGALPGWLTTLGPGLAEAAPGPVALGVYLVVALVFWLGAVLAAVARVGTDKV